jgi:ParB family chromosome partitioning protein
VLIGGAEAGEAELLELPVDAIHPNPRQPRRVFAAEPAAGLAESVRVQGVIQPLLVRPRSSGGYELCCSRSSRTSRANSSRRSRRHARTPC